MNKDLRVRAGTAVVLVEGVDGLWHLPCTTGGLDEAIHRVALCGLSGATYTYGPLISERHCCGVCAQRARAGTFIKPRVRRKRRLPQLTTAQIKVLHKTYVDANVGIPAIATLVWQRLGFPNETSCANSIYRAFSERGLEIRARADSHRRTSAGRRLIGHGRCRDGGQKLDARTIDRLWTLYEAGWSTPQITDRFYTRFGYPDAIKFRNVVEYAWKACGRKMRTNREAELLSRARITQHCAAMKTGSDGRRPRPCSQRPLDGGLYCLHHDPAHQAAVRARAAALRARKVLLPRVPWTLVRPHLSPLLVPRPDRFGRLLERESGALARNTGLDPAICSRYLKGRHETITVNYANKFLKPLGLTVDDLQRDQELIAA